MDPRGPYPQGAGKPEAHAAEWRAIGAPVNHLDAAEMQRLLGAPGYVGGVIDPRGGNLHPLNYALGLADAAERAGARLYCDSRVTGLGPDGDLVTVITGQGRVGHDGAKHRTAKDLREFF